MLRKHAEGHVTCLGAYVVVDLLERWTRDRGSVRSVAAQSPTCCETEKASSNSTEDRGVRFYHAVLKRIGEWSKVMLGARAGSSSAAASASRVLREQKSSSGAVKRKRQQ